MALVHFSPRATALSPKPYRSPHLEETVDSVETLNSQEQMEKWRNGENGIHECMWFMHIHTLAMGSVDDLS
jgi:hypothetical protein